MNQVNDQKCKININSESALKKLNRLHNRDKYFMFKSLSIFTNEPMVILKQSKEIDSPLSTISHLLTLFTAETRH